MDKEIIMDKSMLPIHILSLKNEIEILKKRIGSERDQTLLNPEERLKQKVNYTKATIEILEDRVKELEETT
tara:strand:+ start:180 stop:392 length:213 start_codon:yes stop_codon:yes gene_type:complete